MGDWLGATEKTIVTFSSVVKPKIPSPLPCLRAGRRRISPEQTPGFKHGKVEGYLSVPDVSYYNET